jgi:hypothetical protein
MITYSPMVRTDDDNNNVLTHGDDKDDILTNGEV